MPTNINKIYTDKITIIFCKITCNITVTFYNSAPILQYSVFCKINFSDQYTYLPISVKV